MTEAFEREPTDFGIEAVEASVSKCSIKRGAPSPHARSRLMADGPSGYFL